MDIVNLLAQSAVSRELVKAAPEPNFASTARREVIRGGTPRSITVVT